MSSRTRSILLPIILIWIIIVVTGFYWGHQYIVIPPVIGLIRTLLHLAVVALILLSALGYGQLVAKVIGLKSDRRWESFVYSEGLGLCFLSLLTIVLGLIGLLSSALFWIFTIAGAIIATFALWREGRPSISKLNFDRTGLHRIDYFFLAFIGLMLLLGLQLALTPPIGWDGLTTHLVFARDILAAGKLEPVQVFPGQIAGHMLLIWAMAIGGDVIPQLLNYCMALLMVAAAAFFTNQHFGKRTAILAAAVLVSVEVFIINAGWPYVDIFVGLLSLLAVLALVNWQILESGTRPWLVAVAVLATFAAHTKLNGAFLYPVIIVGLIFGLIWHSNQWKSRLIDIALALAVVIILSLAFAAVENTLAANQAAGVELIPDRVRSTASLTGLLKVFSKAGDYLRVLWEMTIIGQQGALLYDGTISPLFLLLLPVIFFLRRKPLVIWSLIAVVLVELASWLIFPRQYYQNRHLILAYPVFSILVAYTIGRLDEFDLKWFSLSGFFRLLLILIFSMQFLSLLVWWQGVNPMAYLLGMQTRDEFLADNLNGGVAPGYYDMMLHMEEELPADSVVGVAFPEPRIYYCPRDCLRSPFPITVAADEMMNLARSSNLTHILISEKGIDYWIDFYSEDSQRQSNWLQYQRELQDFVSTAGELQFQIEDSFYLYELNLSSLE